MDLKIFAIYDQKAKVFIPPFYAHNEGTALRQFSNAINSPDSDMSKYPEDFTLFLIGEFDDNKGEITGKAPSTMVNGLQMVEEKPINRDQLQLLNDKLDVLSKTIEGAKFT